MSVNARVAVDDCWTAPNRSASGDIMADPARFPAGLVPVIEHIHSLGLKFGLYTSVGESTCNPHGHPIGTWTRHGSYGHYKEDTATFASWGVPTPLNISVNSRKFSRAFLEAKTAPHECQAHRSR